MKSLDSVFLIDVEPSRACEFDLMSLNVVSNEGFAACSQLRTGCGVVGAFVLDLMNSLVVLNKGWDNVFLIKVKNAGAFKLDWQNLPVVLNEG